MMLVENQTLDALENTIPSWCSFTSSRSNSLIVKAQAIQGSGRPTRSYDLMIKCDKKMRVIVREFEPKHLPKECPTRHIERDSSWCLGLRAGEQITDFEGATSWWRKLRVFILLQETAINCEFWPPEAEMSHGDAGDIQADAEELAHARGMDTEFRDALFDRGPIHRNLRLIRRRSSLSDSLINGRANCVCNSTDKRERLKLRRECHADGDECLIRLEVRRLREEQIFIETLKGRGFNCCGTMKKCPFNVENKDAA